MDAIDWIAATNSFKFAHNFRKSIIFGRISINISLNISTMISMIINRPEQSYRTIRIVMRCSIMKSIRQHCVSMTIIQHVRRVVHVLLRPNNDKHRWKKAFSVRHPTHSVFGPVRRNKSSMILRQRPPITSSYEEQFRWPTNIACCSATSTISLRSWTNNSRGFMSRVKCKANWTINSVNTSTISSNREWNCWTRNKEISSM